MKTVNVIIAAAGESQRYGKENKLFEKCGNGCVLTEAITPFLQFEEITKIIVATNPAFFDQLNNWLSALSLDKDGRICLVKGGNNRTETVKNAMLSLDDDCTHVLVHDGARPFLSGELTSRILSSLDTHKVAVPLVALVDNLALITDGVKSVDRNHFRGIQTPMGFDRAVFECAYTNADTSSLDDLATIQAFYHGEIAHVEGDRNNRKVTHKGDVVSHRVGSGYDVHRIEDGDGITLFGVKIPCNFSLVAHSDGDVPVHAIMDAILSALGDKDIGHHFPVDDPAYDDADSLCLLDKVMDICTAKGFKVVNVTTTVIAEEPKLAPYIDEMRARICARLHIPKDCVGISATTNEQVGEIGHGHAIAAYSTVLLTSI